MAEDVISLDDQIEEIDRELRFRERTYPRWVASATPKLSRQAAVRHLARMRAVRESLLELKRVRLGSPV